jgi:hypothetical protein
MVIISTGENSPHYRHSVLREKALVKAGGVMQFHKPVIFYMSLGVYWLAEVIKVIISAVGVPILVSHRFADTVFACSCLVVGGWVMVNGFKLRKKLKKLFFSSDKRSAKVIDRIEMATLPQLRLEC